MTLFVKIAKESENAALEAHSSIQLLSILSSEQPFLQRLCGKVHQTHMNSELVCTCFGVVEGTVPVPPSVHELLIFIRVITVRVIQRVTSHDYQHILQVWLGTLIVESVPKLWGQTHFLERFKTVVS